MKIIGCGSGRCGTKSFARLIDRQKDWTCTHEKFPILPWKKSEILFKRRIEYFENRRKVGDVAFYYLPYLEEIIGKLKNLKVLCLKRDIHSTVQSFMAKMKDTHPPRNHWIDHEGEKWTKDPIYDKACPNYRLNIDLNPSEYKRELIKKYWHDYYEKAEWLSDVYPNKFKIYPIDVLNDRGLQKEMFDFIDIQNPNIKAGIKKNES